MFAGHSAGGHLAVWAAQRADEAGRTTPTPTGILALAPVLDLVESHRLGNPVADLLGGSPVEQPHAYAAADPSARPGPRAPLVVVHGALDVRVPLASSRTWCRRRGGRLVEVADADHFALVDPLSTAWTTVLDAALALV